MRQPILTEASLVDAPGLSDPDSSLILYRTRPNKNKYVIQYDILFIRNSKLKLLNESCIFHRGFFFFHKDSLQMLSGISRFHSSAFVRAQWFCQNEDSLSPKFMLESKAMNERLQMFERGTQLLYILHSMLLHHIQFQVSQYFFLNILRI